MSESATATPDFSGICIRPWTVVRDAYREVLGDFRAVFARFGHWWIAFVVLECVRWKLEEIASAGVALQIARSGIYFLEAYISAGFGVDIFRQRLAGESLRHKALSPSSPRIWRSVALIVAIVLPMRAAMIYHATETDKYSTIFLAFGAVSIVWGFVFLTRWFVAYPMIALDLPESAPRTSWRLTRGNAWRLGVIAILTVMPLLLMSRLIVLLAAAYLPDLVLQYFFEHASLGFIVMATYLTLFAVSLLVHSACDFIATIAGSIITVNVYLLLSGTAAIVPATRSQI